MALFFQVQAADELNADRGISAEILSHLWFDSRHDEVEERLLESVSGVIVNPEGLSSLSEESRRRLVITMNFNPKLDGFGWDLPSATTLSALSNDELIDNFVQQYVKLCRTQGIDYLVISDDYAEMDYAKFVRHLLNHDSSFVISPSVLEVPGEKANKKEIRNLLDQDHILIVQPDHWTQLNKNLKKLRKEDFTQSQYTKFDGDVTTPEFSTQMLTSIYHHSVTLSARSSPSLPLNQSQIAYLAPNPSSPLLTELRRYFDVRDATLEAPVKGQTLLIDARVDGMALAFFLENYKDYHKIALISGDSEHMIDADEYLYFPENKPVHDLLIPQMLYGAIEIDGASQTPLDAAQVSTFIVESAGRLRYAPPEWEGVDGQKLSKIDDLARELIERRAAPGCQVAVIKGSTVILDKSYGHLTYDSLITVGKNTLYDIASVTKVAGTLLAVMHLYDNGLLDLEDSIAQHLTQFEGTNKSDITIKQLLSHQGGFRPYEPLWKRTLKGDFLAPFSYLDPSDEANDVRNYGMPIHPIMRDSIRSWLKNSPLLKDADRYKYSDLGFMVLQQIVESIAGMSIETYLTENFYTPLGLHFTAFNPLDKAYEVYEIAPTEFDHVYRKELVWGTVHDRNAAIFGGVAGHAGLFSSAKELAVIMKMLLNGGTYGGHQFISKNTIDTFNQSYFVGNRRALGWDKYDDQVGNASPHVSTSSFGHTGFTGAMLWADPEHDLIYAFVSNRIYPNSDNKRLQRYDFRNRIQSVIYEAFIEGHSKAGTIPMLWR